MKNLYKILLTIISGVFIAGTMSASLGQYWSTVDDFIPRTTDTSSIGSNTNEVKKIWTKDLSVSGVFTLGGTVGTGGIDLNGEKLILDADADTSITADTDDQIDFELGGADIFTLGFQTTSTLINSIDTSTALTIQNTDTAIGTAGYLLELIHDSDDDADADFLICQDDGAGTPDTVFSIAHDGSIVVGGTLTSTFTDSVSIGNGTASTVDMGAGAAADLYVTDDLEIDGALYLAGDATVVGSLTADTLTLTDHTCVKRIPATNARVGSTAPTPITIENTRGLGFDADAEIAFITEPVPTGWNGTSDLALITAFCGTAGDAIANGEKVTLDISFNSIAEGEAVDNGTENLATATHTSTGDADKELILLSITIDHDNADQPLTAGDALFIKFNRDVTAEAGNTYSGAAIVQRWALQYTSDQPCP